MPDYEKLTVVKLRDELVARGLPRTGLKAALVHRLIKADEQSEGAESAAIEPSNRSQEDESGTVAASRVPQALREPTGSDHAADDAPLSGEQGKHESKTVYVGDEVAPHYDPDHLVQAQNQTGEAREDEYFEEQAPNSLAPEGIRSEKLSGKASESAKEPKIQLPTPGQIQVGEVQAAQDKAEVSTQTSLTGDEVMEDSRKRKRRSQSPPPSSLENTQKRFKASNGRPLVELPEDSMAERAHQKERLSDESSRPDPAHAQEDGDQINGHTCSNGERKSAKSNLPGSIEQPNADKISRSYIDSPALEDMGPLKDKNTSPARVQSAESPTKPSPSDSRFKSLFTVPATLKSASQPSHHPGAEEKFVSPALHSATSALYIRELMRPLKIEGLRDHLVALATPPGTAVNPDILTDYYLDSIRTHCLVGFENISAASRVRSGLHDQVWPNERDRRPLWVDFVPEEKLKKWIDIEQTAGAGRGHPSKRWEVVYEDEENGIKASFREVGSNSGSLRAVQSTKLDVGHGVHAAGPRIGRSEPQSSQPRPDSGKGFRALDDLFKSTAAKPKLYYLPILNAEVDRRLAKLSAGRGGGRGDDMRRFSFEEGSIVDNGPEFGRGGSGSRGGYSGSYWGRGRGYRADAPRGDSWRERRSGY